MSAPALPCTPAGRLRGSVVVFVLGIILLTAFLLTKLMERAAVELAAETKAARRDELRQEALSALEAGLAVVADQAAADQGLHDPRDGWGRPLERIDYRPSEGFAAEVTVSDETGKFSLPRAEEERLEAYLEAIGCPATAREHLVDALLSWTRPDHISARGDEVELAAMPLPYAAPERALRSFEELRAIPSARELFFDEQGRWNELGQRFKAGASLFAFGATNANTAAPEALLAQGLAPARVAALDSARQAEPRPVAGYRSTAELAAVWGAAGVPAGVGAEASCLQMTVVVRRGGIAYRLDAWVARPSAGARTDASPDTARASGDAPTESPAVRVSPRNKFDYPFVILELRESIGP